MYMVTFSRQGYSRLFVPVCVEAGKITAVTVTLIPLTGSLEIYYKSFWGTYPA
jgi:hypothetical protein